MANIADLVFWNFFGVPTSASTTQYASPTQLINYISEWKHIIVGRNNNTVNQKFKIDNRIRDSYFFQIVNKNNQIVALVGDDPDITYEFYGSFIDAKGQIHTLFYSDDFKISLSNILGFKVNTYTSEYLYNVKRPRLIDLTIKIKDSGLNTEKIVLRDTGIAYPTPIEPGMEPTPVIAGTGLTLNGYVMSLQNPVSGSFGAGKNISFSIDSPSFAFGEDLICEGNQLVIGDENLPNSEAAFIIGHGSYYDTPTNIFTVEYSGNVSGGTFYSNGVQVATLNDISGSTSYTAGEGIGISDQNVISLTATIPTNNNQLTNGANYISAVTFTFESGGIASGPSWYFNNDFRYVNQDIRLNYDAVSGKLINYGFALTGQIPLSTSQLINDNHYISGIIIDFDSDTITSSRWEFFDDFKYQNDKIKLDYDVVSGRLLNRGFALTGQIPLSTSQLTNDSGFLTGASVSNKESIYVDQHYYGNNEALQYVSGYNIIYTTNSVGGSNDLQPGAVTGATLSSGEVITFEQWCHRDTGFAAIDINGEYNNMTVIGDVPSSLPAGTTTIVLTRRLANINGTTQQFISYAYCF